MAGDQIDKSVEKKAVEKAAEWVLGALSEMQAAIKEGNIQRLSIANDRVEKQSASMKNELRRLAHFNEV